MLCYLEKILIQPKIIIFCQQKTDFFLHTLALIDRSCRENLCNAGVRTGKAALGLCGRFTEKQKQLHLKKPPQISLNLSPTL